MKSFEVAYLCAERFLLPLSARVRRELRRLVRAVPNSDILDVGGRWSPYTIGVPARVTITDLSRLTDLQRGLNLGVTPEMMRSTLARRSNVVDMRIDDMTQSVLPDESFDCAVAVEVLEHVVQDRAFVENVHRVLRPGGTFLMTTPNGDWVVNTNPDHLRHYTRAELQNLLSEWFDDVEVVYAIKESTARDRGLKSWSWRHPLRTLIAMGANVVNAIESANPRLTSQAERTRHLIATARKRGSSSGAGHSARQTTIRTAAMRDREELAASMNTEPTAPSHTHTGGGARSGHPAGRGARSLRW